MKPSAPLHTDPSLADTGDTSPIPAVTGPVAFTESPSLQVNEHGAGLTAWLELQTTQPTTLTIEVIDPQGSRVWSVDSAATHHRELLLGFRPDSDHTVTVTAHGATSSVGSEPMPWHSEGLPENTPEFVVTGDPRRMEPGVTLFKVAFHLFMVDAEGQVVWFADAATLTHQVGVTPRGTVLYNAGQSLIQEIAPSGEVLRSWVSTPAPPIPNAIEVAQPLFNHDMFEMPDGGMLTVSVEERSYADYPASEVEQGLSQEAQVVGDIVMQIDPLRQVVHEWRLLDLLDPYRIGVDGLTGTYWNSTFGHPVRDWSHANAVWYDPARDEVLVSLRHQDAVVAIDRAKGELAWIFAPSANWPSWLRPYVLQPANPTEQPAYHQHSASLTPDGHLLMFDNGNTRASAFETPLPKQERFSRCLEVSLDHSTHTWTTEWSWGEHLTGADSHLSGKVGDCDRLPQTGNHLIVFGSIDNPDLPPVKLFEVDEEGEVVWELAIPAPSADQVPSMFRAERVTGFIPGR